MKKKEEENSRVEMVHPDRFNRDQPVSKAIN